MNWTATAQNSSGMLPPACLAARPPAAAFECLFPENFAAAITTPLYALQSYHDAYQIGSILFAAPNETAAINAYGALLRTRFLKALPGSAPGSVRGAALDACTHHCGNNMWARLRFPPAQETQAAAFARFYARVDPAAVALSQQDAAYPCAVCCGSSSGR